MLILEVIAAAAIGLLIGIGYIGVVCYIVFKCEEPNINQE